jgi:protein required for attachment to host cells
MSKYSNTLVLLASGERAKCLRAQDDQWGHLVELWSTQRKVALDKTLANDRPGRYRRGLISPRSAFEISSRHDALLLGFLRDVAAKTEQTLNQDKSHGLLVVASPTVMGSLRSVFPAAVRERIVGELRHDYTRTPHERLEELLKNSVESTTFL